MVYNMNFSILAPGSIAASMAAAVTGLSEEYGIKCHSVASRNLERAKEVCELP